MMPLTEHEIASWTSMRSPPTPQMPVNQTNMWKIEQSNTLKLFYEQFSVIAQSFDGLSDPLHLPFFTKRVGQLVVLNEHVQ